MSEKEKKVGRFPCHIFDIADVNQAHEVFQGEMVKDYGEDVVLPDGKVLHGNYMWDDGSRYLVRCKECGGLLIKQASEFHSFTDSPDGYYQDWIPVASEEEADLMNILHGPMDMENVPCRHLRGNNFEYFWTKDPDPVPQDPEELKKKILEKYADVDPRKLEALFPVPAGDRKIDTDLLDRAVRFAVEKHAGTPRKGTDTPYIVHPLEAAAVVAGFTDDQEVIAAAVLHDTLEDTETTKEELVKEFGERVASLVAAESENKREGQAPGDTWFDRKKEALNELLEAGREASIIAMGDKLSNIRAIARDLDNIGSKLWDRFNQKDPYWQGVYYDSLGNIFASKAYLWKTQALQEYRSLVHDAFNYWLNDPNDDPYEPECNCVYTDELEEIRKQMQENEVIGAPVFDRSDDPEIQDIQTIAAFYYDLMTGPNYAMENTRFQITNDPDAEEPTWEKTEDGYALRLCAESGKHWSQVAYQLGYLMMHCLIDYKGRMIGKKEGTAWAEELICEAVTLWAMHELDIYWDKNPLGEQDPLYEKALWSEYCCYYSRKGTSALSRCKSKEELQILNGENDMEARGSEAHDLSDRIKDYRDILDLAEIRRFEADSLLLATKPWMKYTEYSYPVGYVCGLQERIPGCENVIFDVDYSREPYHSFFHWPDEENAGGEEDTDDDEYNDLKEWDIWENILHPDRE